MADLIEVRISPLETIPEEITKDAIHKRLIGRHIETDTRYDVDIDTYPLTFRVFDANPSRGMFAEGTKLTISPHYAVKQWLPITAESIKKIKRATTYTVTTKDLGTFYTNRVTIEGSFIKFEPNLRFRGGRTTKPVGVGEVILPESQVKYIEDPKPLTETHSETPSWIAPAALAVVFVGIPVFWWITWSLQPLEEPSS